MKDLFPITIISRSFAEAVVPRLKLEHGDGSPVAAFPAQYIFVMFVDRAARFCSELLISKNGNAKFVDADRNQSCRCAISCPR
jgi:hypothetical protein